MTAVCRTNSILYESFLIKEQMKSISYILTLAVISVASLRSNAQMNNLSQYHLTPVYTSPAEAGMNDNFQIMMHYRKQSLTGDQGYENISVAGTYPLFYKDGRRLGGIALGVMSERSGVRGIFKEQSVKAGYAYDWQVNPVHHVSFGLHGGYYWTSLALDGITTDAQYQDGAYDPSLGIGENFSDHASRAFRIDAGATWYGEDHEGNRLFSLGFAAFNVNRASYEFIEDQEGHLPVRYQVYGSLRAFSTDKLDIVPTFRYMREKNYDQLNIGSLFLYQVRADEDGMRESQLGMGLWYSLDNAVIASVQWAQPSYILSLSYEIPASSNIQQQQVNNGIEFTLGWRMKKDR